MLLAAMPHPSLRLALPIALGLALLGCNARGHECEGLRSLAGGDPLAGALLGESAKAVEKTLADLDAVKPRTSDLAPARAEYRAALATLVVAARQRDAVIHEMVGVVPKGEGVPPLDPALPDKVSSRVQTLAEPCMNDFLGGLGSIFQKGARPAPPPRPDCEKLGAVFLTAIRPPPGASVAAHVRAVAAGLEAAKLDDPALAEAARGLAALMRGLDPLLSKVTMPAADLLALGTRFSEASRQLQGAQVVVAEKAAAVVAACPAR
jgi:hypothetical protein